jgi:hypothetical protein
MRRLEGFSTAKDLLVRARKWCNEPETLRGDYMLVTAFYILSVIAFVALFLTPGARIPRLMTELFRWLVKKPRVRLWLGLDIAPPVSLRAIQKLVGSWTSTTFVQAGGIGACNHILDEVEELKEILQKIIDAEALGDDISPEDQYNLDLELADILILLIDIAYVRHSDLTDATLLKHYINTLRKWSAPDERGVQHHIEEVVKDSVHQSGPLKGKPIRGPRTNEQELKLLKAFPGMGKAKLAAIIARPDPTIASALNEALNEDEPLTGMEGDFLP